RDFHVTGVQTCALPIFFNAIDFDDVDTDCKLSSHEMSSYRQTPLRAREHKRDTRYATCVTAQLLDGKAIAADIRAEVAADAARKIGRASCRERVEIGAV